MKQLKRFSLLVFVILTLTACGSFDLDALAAGNTSGTLRSGMTDPAELGAFNSNLEISVCEGFVHAEYKGIWIAFQADAGQEAFGQDGEAPFFVFRSSTHLLGSATANPDGNFHFSCAGAAQVTAVPIQNESELWLVAIRLPQIVSTSGERLTENVTLHGLIAPATSLELPDTAVMLDNEAIYDIAGEFQCAGTAIPDSNYAGISVQLQSQEDIPALGQDPQLQGLLLRDGDESVQAKSFTCTGEGEIQGFLVKHEDFGGHLLVLRATDLALENARGQLVVMSGGSTMFTGLISEE